MSSDVEDVADPVGKDLFSEAMVKLTGIASVISTFQVALAENLGIGIKIGDNVWQALSNGSFQEAAANILKVHAHVIQMDTGSEFARAASIVLLPVGILAGAACVGAGPFAGKISNFSKRFQKNAPQKLPECNNN